MNTVLGEKYVAGVAVEATRGVWVEPQDFIRSREPVTVQTEVEKVDIQETEASGFANKGQVTTLKRVTGEAAINMRFLTYGYEKRANVGDALRGGISWRCRVAVNSQLRKGYATCERIPSPNCPIHRVFHRTHSLTSCGMARAS